MEDKIYEQYMEYCIELGYKALASGNPPVGSLITQNGNLIAEGVEAGKTHKDITFHAEIEAIRAAVKLLDRSDLSDCTLYTTHEPCIMCSYVIRHHKIKKIILGMRVPEIGGLSSIYPILSTDSISKWGSPPEIIEGIKQDACEKLQQAYENAPSQ